MSGLVPLAAARDAARFGGKAAGLSRALAADLPVPPGLALTPEAAAAFAAAGDDSAHASHAARAALAHATAELPFPWAVRSSALDEDGARASFAGIHLSVLGVTSLDEAVAAVASVLASADSDGARAYRRRLGLPAGGAERMAVVIQALVPADVAGVLFTRNPASGADERVIEATWGLGEAVVAGLVTPDIVRVARGGALIEARVGVKDVMLAVGADGRRVEREVEPRRAREPALAAPMLAALERLASRCEAFLQAEAEAGTARLGCDLEWAFAADRLHLLQCRRITR